MLIILVILQLMEVFIQVNKCNYSFIIIINKKFDQFDQFRKEKKKRKQFFCVFEFIFHLLTFLFLFSKKRWYHKRVCYLNNTNLSF